MLPKRFFVGYAVRKRKINKFIKEYLSEESFSDIELERTPLGIKIIIHTDRPGRIIGMGGKKINELTDELKSKFKLDNPQIDVKSIDKPDLDAKTVAKSIASSLERGFNFKRSGNMSLERIMRAGAIGAEIILSGKLGGSKGRIGKFTDGYLKHCGQPSKELVDYGFEEANTRPGKIGVKVKIMRAAPLIAEDVEEGKESDNKKKSGDGKSKAKSRKRLKALETKK